MRIEELVPDIVRRWWIVAVMAVAAGVTGFLLASGGEARYSASARLVAEAQPADYWLDLYAKNRIAAYEPLIRNRAFVEDALGEAAVDVSPDHAISIVSVTHATNNNTLTVSATDADPVRTADIVNAIASAIVRVNNERNAEQVRDFERASDEFAPRVVLTQVGRASPPGEPLPNDRRSTTVAAAFLGALAGLGVIGFLIYRADEIRTAEDLARYDLQPLLAIVPGPEARSGR